MNTTDSINHLRVASPCSTSWEQMSGGDRVRFCDLCRLNVYNIAQLTRTEAESLIAGTEGRICARLYRRPDGTIITKDCPVGLRAIRRRAAKVTGAVFATIMSLGSIVMGQKPSSKDRSSSTRQVTTTRKVSDSANETGGVGGTVLDPNGAVVAGAKVIITDRKTKRSRETESNDEGHFLLAGLPPGAYGLEIKFPGFKKLVVNTLSLAENETVSLEAVLLLDANTVTVGIISDTSSLEISTPGTVILSGDLIRRLPH